MITSTSLKHPKMQDKILAAMIEAQENAESQYRYGHGRAYIANSKGNNVMRLDVFKPGVVSYMPAGGVVVYGSSSIQITDRVENALGSKFSELI